MTKALLPGLRPVRLPLGFAVMRSKMRREPDRATVTKVRKICCTTSAVVVAKSPGDALLWIAYPKGTSKRYTCEFNRDKGWGVLLGSGFDCVRQVAIDEDWSALRFRRIEFINHRSR